MAWGRQAFATAQATVPYELSYDLDVYARGYAKLFDAMEAAGYDLSKVKPSAFSGLTGSEVKAAEGRLNQYVNQVC